MVYRRHLARHTSKPDDADPGRVPFLGPNLGPNGAPNGGPAASTSVGRGKAASVALLFEAGYLALLLAGFAWGLEPLVCTWPTPFPLLLPILIIWPAAAAATVPLSTSRLCTVMDFGRHS